MKYLELCQIYEELEKNPSRLKKTDILSNFLEKLKKENKQAIYLLKGKVFPDYDERELGISTQLAIKAIAKATGLSFNEVEKKFKKLGDLGKTAEQAKQEKKQYSLFSSNLTINKVLENLQKLPELEGKGTVDKKLGLIAELLTSASPVEAKYIIKTAIGNLRIGLGDSTIRDAIVDVCFKPKNIEEKKHFIEIVQDAYDKASDFSEVFEAACKGIDALKKIELSADKPVKVMLYPKAEDINDAFERLGKPCAFEFKYDGFRLMIHKQKDKIKLFTRRLENVSKQFPDIVKAVKENIKGDNFIIDSEAIGYNPKTEKYLPFQAISQRIKRKYDIEKLEKQLPIELNIFDIIYYEGKNLINNPFIKRRKLIEKIIKEKKLKIRLAEQIITDSEEKVEKFFNKSLDEGHEGIMAKKLDAPYKPGARVGYGMKIKPEDKDFDLVITGAEYGTGKRAGWLTSYDVSCLDENKLLEVGKVSTGLKEKEEQGLSFKEMTKILKPLIKEEKARHVSVKPEIVVSVTYQNIQKSPTYTSGFALRFPRITRIRPDRKKNDVASLSEIEKEFGKE